MRQTQKHRPKKCPCWIDFYLDVGKWDGLIHTLNNKVIPWLEKQGETYTKKDIDDAWVEGVCYARRELEKQGWQKPANSAKTCKSE